MFGEEGSLEYRGPSIRQCYRSRTAAPPSRSGDTRPLRPRLAKWLPLFIAVALVVLAACACGQTGRTNSAPVMSSLKSDKASPQYVGASIGWFASASDQDGDALQYRFYLDGALVQDWSSDPQWYWKAAEAGARTIQAWVRDGRYGAQ